jgi:hypothetical protein
MAIPMIAVTNASTCLTDAQVEAVLPALQKQVTDDFRAYWDLDCTLVFGARNQQLAKGWWQIVVLDNPDQAGVLGYYEISSQGTPLGKVFAKLDISNETSWTVTYRLDFKHRLSKQLEIAPGGYISVLDPRKGWIQLTAEGEGGPKAVVGSRRWRRKFGRNLRKASAAG